MSDLDVIVMGGKYEKGRKVKTFFVGVLDSSEHGTLAEGSFENVKRTFEVCPIGASPHLSLN